VCKTVTLPFKADFIGNYTFVGEDATKCDPTSYYRVIVDGKGKATHLGNSIVHFDFCCDFESYYGQTYAYIIAANGDTLFMSCEGRVIDGRLEDHPSYVTSYWRDPFVFLGGTGRFKGASGGGMTDDYNSSEDPYSHHHWVGTLKLVKGK
jgi:hypothetical protein